MKVSASKRNAHARQCHGIPVLTHGHLQRYLQLCANCNMAVLLLIGSLLGIVFCMLFIWASIFMIMTTLVVGSIARCF